MRKRDTMLTKMKIRSLTHATFYARGLDLYQSGKVRKIEVKEESFVDSVEARVDGSGTKIYRVRFDYDTVRDEMISGDCNCPAYYSYDGICKHMVAVMLKYADQKGWSESRGQQRTLSDYVSAGNQSALRNPVRMKNKIIRKTNPDMKQLLDRQVSRQTAPLVQNNVFGKVRIEPILTYADREVSVEFRIGAGQLYVLKNVGEFSDRMRESADYEYGKKLRFIHVPEAFEPGSRKLAEFLVKWVVESEAKYQNYVRDLYGYFTGSIRPKMRSLKLSGSDLETLLKALPEPRILVRATGTDGVRGAETRYGFSDYYGQSVPTSWVIEEGSPARTLRIIGQEDGVLLVGKSPFSFQGAHYEISFEDGHIYLEPIEGTEAAREFQLCLRNSKGGELFVQKEDVPAFCRDLLPAVEKCFQCEKENFREQDYNVRTVRFEIYLDAPQPDLVTCRVMAVYGDRKYNVYGEKNDAGQRDLVREIAVGQAVAAYCNAFDQETASMAIATSEDQIYEILTEGIPRMQELGEVFVSDALKRIRVTQSTHVTVGVSLSGELLELSMTAEDMSREELLEILSKYDRRRKYYRLKNGDFVHIKGEGLETLAELKHGLGLTDRQVEQERISLPRYRALYLDQELRGNSSLSARKDKPFRALIRNMRTVEDNDFEVPEKLQNVLRDYQKKGFLWLKTLRHNGFGGILADDMGLGKTLQVLAFLYSEFLEAGEEDNRRCLIVTPASLVYNWYSEVCRFVPWLPATMVVGNAQKRQELIRQSGIRELLITSYDLLKRDIDSYQEKSFFCQIIDEAQFIKNHNTQASKAVKEIQASCKLALTGTPVENRLSELWSIFDYLMPGFLFPYQRFREELEIPIVQQQDSVAMERLQKMIRPFVLRRLKKDVLKDLPDKLEEDVYAVLEGEQQKLYDAHVKRLSLMLDEQTEEEFRTSKIQILSELTKLRQLCCDPSLIYEGFQEESAKRQICLDLVRNAVAGGHKVLLFSQFTSMLDILCRNLDEERITYYTLTGATSKEKRKELVERFQQDDTNVFCISLKAGGTGLNLTAADIVIHYDPWWNLAVQNQATDRAHRIGQRNTVTVYKLVTKGTIEENILKLQERKSALADQVLGGGEVGSGSFTREELLEIIGMKDTKQKAAAGRW